MSALIEVVEILLVVGLDRLDQRVICPLIELVEILRAVGFDTRDSLALSCCSTSGVLSPLIELVEILRAAGFDTRDSLALVGLLNQRGYESAD